MKKFLSTAMIAVLTVCCVLGFAACGSTELQDRLDNAEKQISELTDKVNNSTNTKLQEQIDQLKALIEENKQEAETTITALTARVADLEKALSAAETESASLKTQITSLTATVETLTGTVDTLSESISALKAIVENETSGNAALKAKLDELQTLYTSANQTIATLTADISALRETAATLSSSVSDLRTSLINAETRIELLEAAVTVEPTVLNMGETFTFKSPSGLPMFKVRLVEYYKASETSHAMYFNIERINIPDTVSINQYFNACIYCENRDPKYYYKITDISAIEDCGTDFSKTYNFTFSKLNIPPEEITYFIIGLPSDNDLTPNKEKQYIIPYATYIL